MKPRPKTSITPMEIVEIGIELMKLREIVKYGNFRSSLNELGFSQADAFRFMQAARKFHGAGSSQLLEAIGKVSKLYELSSLEDEEIATLKAGGEVQGITLDSIRTMTVKELRAAIRGVSVAREPMLLTTVEALLLRAHRESTRNVQDVPDKHAAMTSELPKEDKPLGDAVDQLENDFDAFVEFLNQPDRGATGEKTADPAPDLFSDQPQPAPAVPASPRAPAVPVAAPMATGFHVAMLQLVNPIGTWRMACQQVNQGTAYAHVTYHPVIARAGYRGPSSLVNAGAARYSPITRSGEAA